MATRLDFRIQKLRSRTTDAQGIVRTRSTTLAKSEGLFDSPSAALAYIEDSMDEMDPDYTALTFKECERIEKQIQEACNTAGVGIEFKHQGSVTTNTHIRFYSDIDLLVLTRRFVDLQNPLEADNPYKGSPLNDLIEIRRIVESRLETSFPTAKVDKSGGKAVAISGGSLKRKIDVLSAAPLETAEFRRTRNEEEKGIKILDIGGEQPTRIANFPFIHNREINLKDRRVNGLLKRLIRFVKAVRYDSESTINFSSYDIAALCFRMPDEAFRLGFASPYELARQFLRFSHEVQTISELHESLYVPNKTRLIFGEGAASVNELKKLNEDLIEILEQAGKTRGLFND